MAKNLINLPVADGTTVQVYTAVPPGEGPFPGLIVFQEAFGVNQHIRDLTDRFAHEGYIAIAPELFHRTAAPGFEIGYTDFASVAPHMQAVTETTLEADSRACWDWLHAQPKIRKGAVACIGYCMGGRAAFLANAVLPFRAAVSYYGGRIAPDLIKRAPSLHGPMLFFWGGLDKHIPPEQIAEVVSGLRKAAKAFMNVEISYADHGFSCDQRPSFNATATREAWALTLSFLRENLG